MTIFDIIQMVIYIFFQNAHCVVVKKKTELRNTSEKEE